jgi:hypothetical protein
MASLLVRAVDGILGTHRYGHGSRSSTGWKNASAPMC